MPREATLVKEASAPEGTRRWQVPGRVPPPPAYPEPVDATYTASVSSERAARRQRWKRSTIDLAWLVLVIALAVAGVLLETLLVDDGLVPTEFMSGLYTFCASPAALGVVLLAATFLVLGVVHGSPDWFRNRHVSWGARVLCALPFTPVAAFALAFLLRLVLWLVAFALCLALVLGVLYVVVRVVFSRG